MNFITVNIGKSPFYVSYTINAAHIVAVKQSSSEDGGVLYLSTPVNTNDCLILSKEELRSVYNQIADLEEA